MDYLESILRVACQLDEERRHGYYPSIEAAADAWFSRCNQSPEAKQFISEVVVYANKTFIAKN